MSVTFHRISPPFFIQARLQQHSRSPFFNSAYCSVSQQHLSSQIGEASMYNESMICLHKICQNSKDLSIDDFRFSDGSRKISQTPLRPLRSLGFTRIKLYPLSGYILYHECVSVFSKFTSFTEYFVIWCYPVTSALSARRTRNLGSLALFAISAFSGSE